MLRTNLHVRKHRTKACISKNIIYHVYDSMTKGCDLFRCFILFFFKETIIIIMVIIIIIITTIIIIIIIIIVIIMETLFVF